MSQSKSPNILGYAIVNLGFGVPYSNLFFEFLGSYDSYLYLKSMYFSSWVYSKVGGLLQNRGVHSHFLLGSVRKPP